MLESLQSLRRVACNNCTRNHVFSADYTTDTDICVRHDSDASAASGSSKDVDDVNADSQLRHARCSQQLFSYSPRTDDHVRRQIPGDFHRTTTTLDDDVLRRTNVASLATDQHHHHQRKQQQQQQQQRLIRCRHCPFSTKVRVSDIVVRFPLKYTAPLLRRNIFALRFVQNEIVTRKVVVCCVHGVKRHCDKTLLKAWFRVQQL